MANLLDSALLPDHCVILGRERWLGAGAEWVVGNGWVGGWVVGGWGREICPWSRMGLQGMRGQLAALGRPAELVRRTAAG